MGGNKKRVSTASSSSGRLTAPIKAPLPPPPPKNSTAELKGLQELAGHLSKLTQAQMDNLQDAMSRLSCRLGNYNGDLVKSLAVLASQLEEKKTTEGSIQDPVMKTVLPKLGLEKVPSVEMQLGIPSVDKEPYLWPLVWGEIQLTKEQIINKYNLEGEVLQQFRRCLQEHYLLVEAAQRNEAIEKLVKMYRTMAYIYLSTPSDGDVKTMVQLMEPTIIEARGIITGLESTRLDLISGGKGASAVFRAVRTIDPTDLPLGTGDTVKAMRTKAARVDDEDDGPRKRRKATSPQGGGGGGGGGAAANKVKCRKCHKKVLRSKIAEHNKVCKKAAKETKLDVDGD